jgi:hypothetical protein
VSSVDAEEESEPEDDGVQPLDAPDTVDEAPLLMEQGGTNFELAGNLHHMLYVHQVCPATHRNNKHKLELLSAVHLHRGNGI